MEVACMKIKKHQLSAVALIIAMIFSVVLPATATFASYSDTTWHITEDFSDYITNMAPDGVTITTGDAIVAENEERNNKYMELSASKGSIEISQSFKESASVDNLYFSIDLGFEGALSSASVILKTSSGSFTPIKIGKDKSVLSYNGKKLGTLSSDKLTNILITFNKIYSRYSVWINNKKVAGDYYINSTFPSAITGYSISASLSGDIKFFVDDVYAYTSDKIIKKKNFPKKEYNDEVLKIITYDDVIISDTKVQCYYNFEDDPRKYSELTKVFTQDRTPNGNIIEVKQEDNGNKYLSFESLPDGKNFFMTIPCSSLQQVIVEFDICSSTSSSLNLTMYDSNRNSMNFASADTLLKLKSNGVNVGTLSKKSWVKVQMIIDNKNKHTNFYVNGEHTGVDVPMAKDNLANVSSIRFEPGRNHTSNITMLDNVVVYTGTEIRDFSKLCSGEVDETVGIYNHNTKGIEEFLKSYTAIHTVTGKMYVDSMDKASKMPYYENEVLYVSKNDAERLVFGATVADSDDFVALDKFAKDNGKFVTYTRTGTVLVGDKEPILSDRMIVLLNAYMTYDRPEDEVIINDFTSARPRLTINSARLEKIKSEYGKNDYITKWAKSFITQANVFANAGDIAYIPPSADGTGRMLNGGRDMRNRVRILALAYHLTGEQKYVDKVWSDMETACLDYPNWHQQINELDSTMLAVAVAYAYDWLYDMWSPEQKKIMEDALYRNQLDQAYEVYHASRAYGWAATTNNWNPHCNGYTAMAAIAIFESNPQKCADIISNAIKNMEYALLEFYPNGAWKEGPSYWNGTVEPIGELCSTLKNTYDTSYNIENTACLDVTADYLLGTTGPVGVNNFNDSALLKESSRPTYLWFSNTYNKPEYTSIRISEIERGISDFDMLDLLYLNTDIQLGDVDIPLDSYFDRLELVALKSAQGDPNATYVSFHSGSNMEAAAHSHIDSGTFVIDMLGSRFASDTGSHDYFSEGWGNVIYTQPTEDVLSRWRYYNNVPDGHNTLIINPGKNIGQNIISDDKMEAFVSKERGSYAITSLASAYKGYAKDVKRGIMLGDDRRSVTIRDEIELNEGDNEIYWFMHTSISNKITYLDDNTLVMDYKDKKVKLMFVTNADSYEVFEGECIQLGLEPSPEQKSINSLKRLTIKMNAKDSVYLQVKLIPLDDPLASEPIADTPLRQWSIPDGELRKLPYINSISLDGVKSEHFNFEAAVNDIPVDIKCTQPPAITWDINPEFDAEIIKYPANIDDTTVIKVWRKDEPNLFKTYTITFNPYSIEALEPYKVLPVSAEANHVPQSENGPDAVFDDDLNTRWAADGKGVWIVADLGESKHIDFIGTSFMNGDQRSAKYQLFISEDNQNWEMVFDGTSSGTTSGIEICDRINKNARYIKLVGFGNSSNEWNSVTELRAYSLGF